MFTFLNWQKIVVSIQTGERDETWESRLPYFYLNKIAAGLGNLFRETAT